MRVNRKAIIVAIASVGAGALLGFATQEQPQYNLELTPEHSQVQSELPPSLRLDQAQPEAVEPAQEPVEGQDGTTPDNPATEPETQPEPEPEPEPEPVFVYSKVMRFVDVSPPDEPNTVAQQWCDRYYSDGSVISFVKATITGQFNQPIESYSSDNPPGAWVAAC